MRVYECVIFTLIKMQIIVKATVLYLLLGFTFHTYHEVYSQLVDEVELSGPNVCKRIEE